MGAADEGGLSEVGYRQCRHLQRRRHAALARQPRLVVLTRAQGRDSHVCRRRGIRSAGRLAGIVVRACDERLLARLGANVTALEATWYDEALPGSRALVPLEESSALPVYQTALALLPSDLAVIELGCGTGRFA